MPEAEQDTTAQSPPPATAEPEPTPNVPATQDDRQVGQSLKARDMKIGPAGINFTNAGEVLAFAKMMSQSGFAVGPDFRDNPGACLALVDDGIRFGMSPYFLSRKAYPVNGRLAYESAVLAAVIITRAPIVDRPSYAFEGEGANRVCVVTVTQPNGRVIEHRSPPFATIQPKNSPLWKSDPDQQQGYYTVRALARRHFPDVLAGAYDLEEAAAARAMDVTPPEALPKPRADFAAAAKGGQRPEVRVIGGTISPGISGPLVPQDLNTDVADPVGAPPAPKEAPGATTLATPAAEPSPAAPAQPLEATVAKGHPADFKKGAEKSLMAEIAGALAECKTATEVRVVLDEFAGAMAAVEPSLAAVMKAAADKRTAELTEKFKPKGKGK